jgi:hypothetical protein
MLRLPAPVLGLQLGHQQHCLLLDQMAIRNSRLQRFRGLPSKPASTAAKLSNIFGKCSGKDDTIART